MRYSNDLRVKVTKMFDKGMKRRNIATTLQINLSTLSQWKQQHKEDKLLVIKEYKRGFKSRFDKQAIKEYVEDNPDKYLREIKEVFTISKTRLALILHELGLTLQRKKTLYKKRNETARTEFIKHRQKLEQEENTIIIYQDECGIENDLYRQKARSVKSQYIYHNQTATKHKATGIISGYFKLPNNNNNKYIYLSPFIYYCNCDTNLFNQWLKTMLIPGVTKLQQIYPNNKFTLQMDNVAYHKSQATKDLLQQANILPLFQPPYSPDLNKIEPSWLHLKLGVISQSYQQITFEDKLCDYLTENSW